MKSASVSILLSAFIFLPNFAQAVTIRCEFIKRTSLKGFTAVLNEDSAQIQFEGLLDLNFDLDPSGEAAVLDRSESAPGWVIYKGDEILQTNSPCVYFTNDGCASPARHFSLNLPDSIFKNSSTEGSLSFSELSNYLPGEALISHSIRCSRK